MRDIIQLEMIKIFARKRSYIGFIAILVIMLASHAAMLWEGQSMYNMFTSNLSEAFYMQGNLVNGYLITYIVLNFLWVHIPFLIVIVTADLLSGEANSGTFRILLTRPVSRAKLVTAKFIAAIVYTFLLMLFFAILSLVLGLVLFGKGDLIVVLNTINVLPQDDLMWRFIFAFVFGFIGMTAIAALSLLFSAMANNSLGPILSTMAVIIFFTLISTLNFKIFSFIRPILFTSYLDSWQLFFDYTVNIQLIIRDGVILGIYSLVFYGATVFYFNRKDILT